MVGKEDEFTQEELDLAKNGSHFENRRKIRKGNKFGQNKEERESINMNRLDP